MQYLTSLVLLVFVYMRLKIRKNRIPAITPGAGADIENTSDLFLHEQFVL